MCGLVELPQTLNWLKFFQHGVQNIGFKCCNNYLHSYLYMRQTIGWKNLERVKYYKRERERERELAKT